MIPTDFPEANCNFIAPDEMDSSQVMSVRGFIGKVSGGSVDGAHVIVTAWIPTDEEIEKIKSGFPIFLSVLGGLPPHFLTTDFHTAIHPV